MTATHTPNQPDANEARRTHITNMATALEDMRQALDALRYFTADMAPTDWRFTGRGAELADVEAAMTRCADFLHDVTEDVQHAAPGHPCNYTTRCPS